MIWQTLETRRYSLPLGRFLFFAKILVEMERSFPGWSVQLISLFNWKVAFHSLHEISESLNLPFCQMKTARTQ